MQNLTASENCEEHLSQMTQFKNMSFLWISKNSISISFVFISIFLMITIVNIECTRHNNHHHHTSSSRSLEIRQQEYANRFSELLSKNWSCENPKPRLVYISEEFTDKFTSDIEWNPTAALLYRCDKNCGYCSSKEKSCQAIREDSIPISFLKLNPINNKFEYEDLMFKNHTECGCRPI